MDRGAWGLQSRGSQRVSHDQETGTHFSVCKVTQNVCIKYYYLGPSERSYRGGYGIQLCPRKAHRVLLDYIWTIIQEIQWCLKCH